MEENKKKPLGISGISIVIVSASGVVHRCTDAEVYEIDHALGWSEAEGVYQDLELNHSLRELLKGD